MLFTTLPITKGPHYIGLPTSIFALELNFLIQASTVTVVGLFVHFIGYIKVLESKFDFYSVLDAMKKKNNYLFQCKNHPPI